MIALRVPTDVYDRVIREAALAGITISALLRPRLFPVNNKSTAPISAAQ